MGRPKTQFDLKKVEKLASQGLTDGEIADYFGVAASTVSNHKIDKDFLIAHKKGRATGISAVANALYEKAIGGDTAAMIFYLRSRAGWIEPQRIKQELITKDKASINMTDGELNAQISQMLLEWTDEETAKYASAFAPWLADTLHRIEDEIEAEY